MGRGEVVAEEYAQMVAAVGQMLRESREARGWSLTESRRRSGVLQEHLRALEQGERRPSWWTLCRLCAAFYPYDDGLALRAARRLAESAGAALVTTPPRDVPAADRAFRLAYPAGRVHGEIESEQGS